MPSFGENLRREREKRKITLDQISQTTKIGTRMLQALEEDKFNQLPGGIFNKGFVRAYARSVGLDEEQTIADYLQASGEAPPVMPEMVDERSAPRIEASIDAPERPLPWGLFAALLLVAALALSLWSHRQKKEDVRQQQLRSETSQASAQKAPPLPGMPNPAPIAPANSNVSTTTATPQPAIAPATTSLATPASSAASSTPAAGGFAINILAHEDSWTLIISDGRTVYSGLLAAGDERTVRGQKEVVIRTGNSGGVDLFFNGKKLPPAGQYGEIKTITFGPNGITPNRPVEPPTQ